MQIKKKKDKGRRTISEIKENKSRKLIEKEKYRLYNPRKKSGKEKEKESLNQQNTEKEKQKANKKRKKERKTL